MLLKCLVGKFTIPLYKNAKQILAEIKELKLILAKEIGTSDLPVEFYYYDQHYHSLQIDFTF